MANEKVTVEELAGLDWEYKPECESSIERREHVPEHPATWRVTLSCGCILLLCRAMRDRAIEISQCSTRTKCGHCGQSGSRLTHSEPLK